MECDDYDFTALADWPKHALNVAWLWKLDRELGSGRGPFYIMWQIHELKHYRDPKTPIQPTEMLHSHSLPQVAACCESEKESVFAREKEVRLDFKSCGRFGGAYTRIHALEIDWRLPEKKLVEMFRNWLRHGDHDFRPDMQMDSRNKKGRRDTAGLHSYLRDLAIYRISVAGFTHKEGLKMLGLKMSAQNWERAQRKINKKIRWRIGLLCQCAKLEAVGGVKDGFWKDYFIGMDSLDDAPCL